MASGNINFEVMVLQDGHWEVHGSYPHDQQGQAIRDAKALEKISTIKGVKVVREETDSRSGEARENNIYASSHLADEQPKGAQEARLKRQNRPAATRSAAKKIPAKGKTGKSGKNSNMRSGKEIPRHIAEYDPDSADAATFSLFRLVVRLLMVVLFSGVIAATVSGLGGIWLGETKFRAATQANIINVLLFGSFFLSVVWMSVSFLSKAKITSSRRRRAAPVASKPEPEKYPPRVKPADRVDFGKEAGTTEDKNRIEPDPQDSATAGISTEPGDGAEAVIQEQEQEREDSPWVKKQKAFVMDYLADSMENSDLKIAAMDNFNKFGINLFIAGAIETLCRDRDIDGNTASQILGDAVKFMGFKNRDAGAFADKIQGYLLADSRYMQMYQAGRGSMIAYLENDPGSAATMTAALTEWNKPKSAEKASGPVTVLFTDIAGSTNMTQALGDVLAQQVVRAHNKVVRDALHKFNGVEIKHTGDGIMASFSKTSHGVEAAVEIQKGAVEYSTANPDLPLGLKIGINAGEPIAEDDDLFGATVQMAARIVDKAEAGQIFVSATVKGLCSGKNFDFTARPGFTMNGFDGTVTLYELPWNADPGQPVESVEPAAKTDNDPAPPVNSETAPEEPVEPENSAPVDGPE